MNRVKLSIMKGSMYIINFDRNHNYYACLVHICNMYLTINFHFFSNNSNAYQFTHIYKHRQAFHRGKGVESVRVSLSVLSVCMSVCVCVRGGVSCAPGSGGW